MKTYKPGDVLDFGKHKNEIIDDVIKNDFRYVEWLLECTEFFEMSTKLLEIYNEFENNVWSQSFDLSEYDWADGYDTHRYGKND